MKIYRAGLLSVFLLVMVAMAYAQQSPLFQSWTLQEKKGIQGTLYTNSVPGQVSLREIKNGVVIAREAMGGTKFSQMLTDTILFSAANVEKTIRAVNRKKVVTGKWIKKNASFSLTHSTLNIVDKKSVDAKVEDVWEINKEGNLTLRRYSINYLTGEIWESVGVYRRTV